MKWKKREEINEWKTVYLYFCYLLYSKGEKFQIQSDFTFFHRIFLNIKFKIDNPHQKFINLMCYKSTEYPPPDKYHNSCANLLYYNTPQSNLTEQKATTSHQNNLLYHCVQPIYLTMIRETCFLFICDYFLTLSN